MYFVLSFIMQIALFLEKFTPLAKILHCRLSESKKVRCGELKNIILNSGVIVK